jgi:hypothetical protein
MLGRRVRPGSVSGIGEVAQGGLALRFKSVPIRQTTVVKFPVGRPSKADLVQARTTWEGLPTKKRELQSATSCNSDGRMG